MPLKSEVQKAEALNFTRRPCLLFTGVCSVGEYEPVQMTMALNLENRLHSNGSEAQRDI